MKIAPVIGAVMVEPAWRAPEGVGAIAPHANLTAPHASYHARPKSKGDPIAVGCLF